MKTPILLGVWFLAVILLLWRLFESTYSPFAASLFSAQPKQYLQSLYSQVASLVNYQQSDIWAVTFYRSGCRCNRGLNTELDRVKSTGAATLEINIDNTTIPDSLKVLIPSTPALVVVSKQHRLASYFGPHSDAAVCGKGNSMMPPVVKNLQKGFNPAFMNVGNMGCYCKTI